MPRLTVALTVIGLVVFGPVLVSERTAFDVPVRTPVTDEVLVTTFMPVKVELSATRKVGAPVSGLEKLAVTESPASQHLLGAGRTVPFKEQSCVAELAGGLTLVDCVPVCSSVAYY